MFIRATLAALRRRRLCNLEQPRVCICGLWDAYRAMNTTPRKPLRLWPGVLAVALQWLVMFGMPIVVPQYGGTAIIGGVIGGFLVLIWWLLFSRAPWLDRLGAIVLMVAALAITRRFVHASIATGMMGFMPYIYGIPLLSLALVVWAAASRGLSSVPRRASLVAAVAIACMALTIVRTDGLTGDADSDFEWRWTPTPEEQLLARADEPEIRAPIQPSAPATPPPSVPPAAGTPEQPAAPTANVATESPAAIEPPFNRAEWPGFRGP